MKANAVEILFKNDCSQPAVDCRIEYPRDKSFDEFIDAEYRRQPDLQITGK